MSKITKLRDLIPDQENANKGTERGNQMLEQSLQKYGAGRSILIDKKGRIIAGNKTVEMAGQMGITEVEVVQTDGRRIIAVQRMDLDLEEDLKAKELAIADNRVAEVNLDWDAQVIAQLSQEVNIKQFFLDVELKKILGEHLEAADFDCCGECGRRMPKSRSTVSKGTT